MSAVVKSDVQEPEAWVGCLACYNAGRLVGEWVDALEAGEFEPCRRAGHEEFWVFDFQGFWGALTGECSPAEAQRIAGAFNGLESYEDPRAYGAWVENGGEVSDSLETFREQFCGEWDSEEDYAQNFAEDIGAIDEGARWPATCIDWERATRELFMDGLWSASITSGGVFIFDSNR